MYSSRASLRLAIAASGLSFLIGLFFIFVRAPHPWGWEGIDHYRELALAVARGEPYPSLERLWGYPYFLAAFYRLFGDRPWIPLVVQALLNATIPLMVFVEVRRRIDAHTGAVAALLAGVLSFNTIYASTQAADGLCTVLFVAAIVCFGRASASGSVRWFALSGVLAGLALLLRPNLLFFPTALVVADAALRRRRGWHLKQSVAFLLAAVAVWLPWPIRNYTLTDRFIPATTHGGIQLWYGSLQVGEYFERWFDNPRAQLEASPFDYSLPTRRSLEVSAKPATAAVEPTKVLLTYWTNRRGSRTTIEVERSPDGAFRAQLPPMPPETVLYYYFDATWTGRAGDVLQSTPLAGASDPLRHVVTDRHFADLDLNHDTLDVFDVGRLVAAVAGQQAPPTSLPLDLDRDGSLSARDLDVAAGVLVAPAHGPPAPTHGTIQSIEPHPDHVRLVLQDGSALRVPTVALTRTTDLDVEGADTSMAANLIRSARSFAGLQPSLPPAPTAIGHSVDFVLRPEVNKSFSRVEPLWMDRYTQLAIANIERSPSAFVTASLRRILRMFFVLGSDDRFRAAQFEGSSYVYAAATLLSSTYAVLLVAGVVIAWRRGYPMALWLVAVLYIPATILMFLPNMRYVVTAQPFHFIFVAVALIAVADWLRSLMASR